MNVADMLKDVAFKTTRKKIASAKAIEILAAGRAQRADKAMARRAEIPELVRAGKTVKEIAEIYGREFWTIRDDIAAAVKNGSLTNDEAKSALPPIIHQRDRVYKKAHASSIALRVRMHRFINQEPRSMSELSKTFSLSRASIMTHVAALEIEGKVRRIKGYPYKIAAVNFKEIES